MSPFDGLSSNLPNLSKREPWQGQSQECSALFQRRAHPMCGQRLEDSVSRLEAASKQLTNNCGFRIVLEGWKTGAKGFSFPRIISVRRTADIIDAVMPPQQKPAP